MQIIGRREKKHSHVRVLFWALFIHQPNVLADGIKRENGGICKGGVGRKSGFDLEDDGADAVLTIVVNAGAADRETVRAEPEAHVDVKS